jgi:L-aspartate oxidase
LAELPTVSPTIIVGAGIAGLFAALKLAPTPVTVISPVALGEGASSAWAQGGIAAAVGLGDTPFDHARDTIAAGAGLVDIDIANGVASDAPDRIRDLLSYGVPFDRDLEGHFVLSREAAHSNHRVVRVSGDRAGAAIMQALIASVRATPSITVIEGYRAVDLIAKDRTVTGITLVPTTDSARSGAALSVTGVANIVLATGGIGGLYRVTTNPKSSTGQGIAMAARAGAIIADAEFVQFHPTAIATDIDPAPLASEALRGEGAVLVNAEGKRFMEALHPAGDLAPRDVVARGVFSELQAGRGAFLDCRDAIGAAFAEHFPTVYAKCRDAGIDPANEPIPIVPAEHYHMGGVRTDADGATSVTGLYAIGEVAATGLHGANRLASNSLLEAVVFAGRVAERIAADDKTETAGGVPTVTAASDTVIADPAAIADAQARVRAIMADRVGVVRDHDGLRSALIDLADLEANASGALDIVNMTTAARFITEAALRRKESRGSHFRTDYPEPLEGEAARSQITLAGLGLRAAVLAGGAASPLSGLN